MSTGEGGGTGPGPSGDQDRRRTPPPRRRTPPPRTSSQPPEEPGVEHRPAAAPRARKSSAMGRLMGREGLQQALEDRFRPYTYESPRPTLRWLYIGVLVFIAVGIYGFVTDFQFRNTLREWQSEGISQIPPSSEDVGRALFAAQVQVDAPEEDVCNEQERASGSLLGQGCQSMDRMFAFSSAVGVDCSTPEQIILVLDAPSASPGCDRVVDLTRDYGSMSDRSNMVSIVLLIVLVFAAFPFSTFTHRASRNLRTMKAEGQRYSPDGAVIRFFIPFITIRVFVELFRASDPRVPPADATAWKKQGGVPPIAILWGLLWPAMLFFNPILVQRAWFNQRENMPDVERILSALLVSDGIVIALGVAAILMARSLSAWQDAKAARHGTVTVTPPRPVDPIEKALNEGVRRQDAAPGGRGQNAKRRK